MKIWLISQTEENGYDSFDSAVVVAENELQAKRTHPSQYYIYNEELHEWVFQMYDGTIRRDTYHRGDWCHRYQDVRCEYIGEARKGHPPGIVCASFNEG